MITHLAATLHATRRTLVWSLPALRRYGVAAWLTLLPILGTVVIVRHRNELAEVGRALPESDPRWIAVGIAIEALSLVGIGLTYRSVVRRLGYPLSGAMLIGTHLRRMAVGAVSPLSAPVSAVMFCRIVRPHGVRLEDALLALGLRSAATNASFILIAAAAVVVTGALSGPLAAFAVMAATLVVVGSVMHARSRRVLPLPINRLPVWARGQVLRFLVRARQHQLEARDLAAPLALAVGARLGSVGLLFAALHALGDDVSVRPVALAYSAGLLATLAMPVLQGAGAVETTVALALVQGGVPTDVAIGATLVWRLIEFWIPLVSGLLLQIGSVARSRLSARALLLARAAAPSVSQASVAPARVQREPRVA